MEAKMLLARRLGVVGDAADGCLDAVGRGDVAEVGVEALGGVVGAEVALQPRNMRIKTGKNSMNY